MRISVYFFNQPGLHIQVNDTRTGRLFFDLNQRINQQLPVYYRDTRTYTTGYMVELAHRARDAFGWNWFPESYDRASKAKLHKDLENYVGRLSFKNIPEEHDELLYELHHCLHAIYDGKNQPERSDNLQIEWFTDESVPLPECFEFQETCQFGDLILINPYVGHNPLQIYQEDDFQSLHTTCRFHDIIKPGVVVSQGAQVTKDEILTQFKRQAPAFVQQHGEEKIRRYAGSAVIGSVEDPEVFRQLLDTEQTLVIDRVLFHD